MTRREPRATDAGTDMSTRHGPLASPPRAYHVDLLEPRQHQVLQELAADPTCADHQDLAGLDRVSEVFVKNAGNVSGHCASDAPTVGRSKADSRGFKNAVFVSAWRTDWIHGDSRTRS